MSIPTDKAEWPSDYFSNDLRLMAATIIKSGCKLLRILDLSVVTS